MTQISLDRLNKKQISKLNSIARKNRGSICNAAFFDEKVTEPVVYHTPYGLATASGKFYPGRTWAKWRGGWYSPAFTKIVLPVGFNL
jgi:hypothetical protein